MKTLLATAGLLLAMFAPVACAQEPADEGLTEALHTVSLSGGSTLNVLISRRSGSAPDIAVLLFAGYPGVLRLREEGGTVVFDLAGNFLLRARRHLNSDRVHTVVVDCPAERLSDCGDTYRSSAQHASDISDVVTWLREKQGAKQVYVAGTSYGTVSTSFLARGLHGRIDGAIHTATFTDPRAGRNSHGTPMAAFDWSLAKVPQLFVHHRNDPCDLTRYSSVVSRRAALPLITVEGVSNPRGKACLALTEHGFVGRERPVMLAIHAWIVDRTVAAVID
jgi:hypothetical protein